MRRIVYAQSALSDLIAMESWIAEQGAPRTAAAYVERLQDRIATLAQVPLRGLDRGDLLPGLRIMPFEASATIAFSVDDGAVVILRVFYRGRDWEKDFEEGETP